MRRMTLLILAVLLTFWSGALQADCQRCIYVADPDNPGGQITQCVNPDFPEQSGQVTPCEPYRTCIYVNGIMLCQWYCHGDMCLIV